LARLARNGVGNRSEIPVARLYLPQQSRQPKLFARRLEGSVRPRTEGVGEGQGQLPWQRCRFRPENSPLNCFLILLTFFKSIKAKLTWRRTCKARRQAALVFGQPFEPMAVMPTRQDINGIQKPHRHHSALAGKSPLAFERQVAQTRDRSGSDT
jgi:hypothetical protein